MRRDQTRKTCSNFKEKVAEADNGEVSGNAALKVPITVALFHFISFLQAENPFRDITLWSIVQEKTQLVSQKTEFKGLHRAITPYLVSKWKFL